MQHQLTASSRTTPLVIQLSDSLADSGQATAYVLDSSGNLTLAGPAGAGGLLTVQGHIVQGHSQVQEVHVTDESGNIQQLTYASYAEPSGTVTLSDGTPVGISNVVVETGNHAHAVVSAEEYASVIQAIGVSVEPAPADSLVEEEPASQVDASFQYFDNLRGKINTKLLFELTRKYDAENPNLSKNDRLHQWALITSEYQHRTGQDKTRTTLMKRWCNTKYYRKNLDHRQDNTKGAKAGDPSSKAPEESNSEVRLQKEYENLQLLAARMERDAQQVCLENAMMKQERLKKEIQLASMELISVKFDLAMKQEEAREQGIILQFEEVAEDNNDDDPYQTSTEMIFFPDTKHVAASPMD